jgi:GAF domain-containing protein
MSEDRLRDAVAAGALASENSQAAFLRSIVDVARAIFAARAASIMLLERESGELVFEAVSGEGSEDLVGSHFPANYGVAGWVATAAQPLILDDVADDPRFSQEVAESTGYLPRALMAVPLIGDEDVVGVLSVLDRSDAGTFELAQMELLELFARQAAIAVEIVRSARAAQGALSGSGDVAVVARLAAALEGLEGERRDAGMQLLSALEALLADPRSAV